MPTLSANFVAGKVGYATTFDETESNFVEHPLAKWRLPIEADWVKRHNFKSRGFREGVPGFIGSRFTVSGPYAKHTTSQALVVGRSYMFFLGIDTADVTEFEVAGTIIRMTPTQDAETGPEIEYEVESIGQLSIASCGGTFGLDVATVSV